MASVAVAPVVVAPVAAPFDVLEGVCEKKSKVDEDASGLVPYGGDSSDEEEERTHSSKSDTS